MREDVQIAENVKYFSIFSCGCNQTNLSTKTGAKLIKLFMSSDNYFHFFE